MELVIFDWDGTLFDSDREIWRAHSIALRLHGYATEPYETFRHREGNGLARSLGHDVSEATADEVRATFYKHYQPGECNLVEGAHEVLSHIQLRGLPRAIVSAHRSDEIVANLERFSISHHFPQVIGGMHDKKQALRQLCEAGGVAPHQALFVGDLLSDVLDGNAVGLKTVLLAPAETPHAHHADHHITELIQLVRLLTI